MVRVQAFVAVTGGEKTKAAWCAVSRPTLATAVNASATSAWPVVVDAVVAGRACGGLRVVCSGARSSRALTRPTHPLVHAPRRVRGTSLASSLRRPRARVSRASTGGLMRTDSTMTRPSRRRRSVILALAVTAVLARFAVADDCPSACGLDRWACLQGARVHKLACKIDCRSSAARGGLGGCVRSCMVTFRSAKDACDTEQGGCMDGCGPGAPPAMPPECRAMCGHDFAACVQDVVVSAHSCFHDCRTARDRRACVGGCAMAARQGAAGCTAGFKTCAAGCGGSPGAAFLDPVR